VKYGFLDESGDVEYSDRASRYLIVLLVLVSHPGRLRKAILRTRKALGKRVRDIPELKAAGGDPRLVQKVLRHAADTGFEAVAVVLDKKRSPQPMDPEGLYRYACVQTVQGALEQHGPLSLTLDRRYKTAGPRQHALEQALRSCAAETGTPLDVQQEDSRREPALQVADAVCWALFQKYERREERFWQQIQERVRVIRL